LGKTFEEPWGSAVVAECKIGLIGKEESWRVEMDKDFGRRPRDGRGQIELISAKEMTAMPVKTCGNVTAYQGTKRK
jgi:hypothetical protein